MKSMNGKHWVICFVMFLSISMLAGCNNTAQAPATADQAGNPGIKDDADYYDDADYEDEYYDDEYYEDDYYEDEYYEDEEYDDTDLISEDDKAQSPRMLNEGTSPAGRWYTEDYDVNENWASSYIIELFEDGTATCNGWRNKDAGTYKADGNKVLITFDDCQVDSPGEGFVPVKGFKYTINMDVRGDEATIRIDAPDVISNLEDGKLHRKAGEKVSEAPDENDRGSVDIADDTYHTDAKYKGEISKDGSTVTIETALSHYDKDWNEIKDYDKQVFAFNTSGNCKCVIVTDEYEEAPIADKTEFINDMLKGSSGLPITLVIKNNELVEMNFSS